jgi:acyl-coenzyme A synthetase/AMP-(fatty) acid ligase
VDRWCATQGDKPALIAISTETNTERSYSFNELRAEVQRFAAMMQSLGVRKGDRVLIYMPMIAEAAFAMLACARIGAVHSVVFGGFAANSLASRIDDAKPVLIVSADAGSRGGKAIPYKPLLDEAIALSPAKPRACCWWIAAWRRWRWQGATWITPRCVPRIWRRRCRSNGWNRTNRPTSSTPPAPPASRKACSATSAATRWRWRRR